MSGLINARRRARDIAWALAAVAAAAGPASAEIQIHPLADRVEVMLPAGTPAMAMRSLQWSSDLVVWSQVARDYGFGWENTFPHALSISAGQGTQALTDDIPRPATFYRILESSFAPLANLNAVSRFLQQATFGPAPGLLETFPGVDSGPPFNEPPYAFFEAWIDAQAALPPFLLRVHWRQRSNPAFVDNTAASPGEVAHDPALGVRYIYNIGQDKYYPDPADAIAAGRPSTDVTFSPQETKQMVWYQGAVTGGDALRQRVAWALSQLFVVGESGSNQPQAAEKFLSYYDIFIRNALGNFRDVLGEVTWHPVMGYYLTYVDNRKADPVAGTFPDENYAREVMQLFTIGLWMLDQDGRLRLDADGELMPTYDNSDIEEFAKVFTGLRLQPARGNIEIVAGNHVDPMRVQVSWHDFSAKTLLDGSVLGPFPATEQGVRDEVDGLLDHLFNHPNTPPFVARFLIQRLTVSNPSPRYIRDVAQAFIDGRYAGRGSGRRGDLLAVVKAVLLHPEARTPALAADAAHGALREPLVRLLHFARAFSITSPQTFGQFPFTDLNLVIAQSPFDAPSVFNYYLPDYQPVGPVLESGLYAPEFQIHTDVTALSLPNAVRTLVYSGISGAIGRRTYSQGDLDLSRETALAADAAALLDRLDLMLTAGRLSPANRDAITAALAAMPSASDAQRRARVQRALSLFSMLPEFNVMY